MIDILKTQLSGSVKMTKREKEVIRRKEEGERKKDVSGTTDDI